MDDPRETIRAYLLDEFLPGEDPAALTDRTPLITGGILDSIGTLNFVAMLESTFGVSFEAHEVGVENLDTIEQIAETIVAKRRQAA